MNENTRIIEVGGVKLEVDLRTAKRVDSYRVGDPVKVLRKSYGDSWETSPGVIIGFTEFANRPSIEVMVCKISGYSAEEISIISVTKDTKDIEIAPYNAYQAKFGRSEILARIDRSVSEKRNEILLLETKRAAFVEYFGKLFPADSNTDNPGGVVLDPEGDELI